jgi:hypothetical protein
MPECPPPEPTRELPEDQQVSQRDVLEMQAQDLFANLDSERFEVPKYPLRIPDEQTELMVKADYRVLCELLAPRVDSWQGIRAQPDYRWEADEVGRARLRQQIRQLLIEPGDYLLEELEDWTLTQIVPILIPARKRADEALRAEQKAQLQEPWELGLRCAGRWQQYVRQAVAIVRQYHERHLRGHTGLRAPFPEMIDATLAGFRHRDMGDIPWMFFVLGEKLETVFNTKGIFIPGDLYDEIRHFWLYFYPNVHHYAHGRMSADELSDLWVIIRPVLLAEEAEPAEVTSNAGEASESRNAPPGSQSEEILHSDDFRRVKYHGYDFTFTDYQAAAVKLLWEQESGELGQAYILEKIDSATDRLRNVFKRKGAMHPAWGTMIIRGQTKGTYRLAPRKKP